MKSGRFRIFRSDMGQDIRTWPMLALLLLVIGVAIGCVLWFMREAMQNERLAVRQKLSEAYRGQLVLVQKRVEEEWQRGLERLDQAEPGPALFAIAVRGNWADAIVCLDASGGVIYPHLTSADRDSEANAELLALEGITDQSSPDFKATADRLIRRVNDYQGKALPAAQRRFLMRELQRLCPGVEFATLGAEDLAAKFLEGNELSSFLDGLRETRIPGIWACGLPTGRVIGLFSTANVRAKLRSAATDASTPEGVRLSVIAPHDDAQVDGVIATTSLGSLMPGWRLALLPSDRAGFDSAAESRVTTYLWIGSSVIGAMTLLIVVVARGFTRQVQLARIKNDLVATVSHELKTPLTAMRALVDTLVDSEHLEEKTTREYLHLLSRENARLSRLIENFLTFSRLERNRLNLRFEQLRPEQIVEGAVAAIGERSNAEQCHFQCETALNLPPIMADQNALTTALLNLLDNAWKYTGEEKRITLRTWSHNGSVSFAVEDNGIGIPQRESDRVFQRFYQVDQRLSRTSEGCGLGLSIVRSIVNAHQGTVSLASVMGAGSTFTIEIPAASQS